MRSTVDLTTRFGVSSGGDCVELRPGEEERLKSQAVVLSRELSVSLLHSGDPRVLRALMWVKTPPVQHTNAGAFKSMR